MRAVSILYQLGETDSARALLKIVPVKFQYGNQASGIAYANVSRAANSDEAKKAYLGFVKRCPAGRKDKTAVDELDLYDGLNAMVAEKYAQEGNAEKSLRYFNLIDLRVNKMNVSFSLATTFYQKDDIIHGNYF